MDSKLITRRDEWNTFLARVPNSHILQTWEWGEFKSHYGWAPTRVMLELDEGRFAAAQVLRRSLPYLNLGILYVPRGPALDYSESADFNRALGALEQLGRRQNVVYIKIDPALECDKPAAHLLRERGWIASRDQIQYRNTLTLDLKKNESELFASIKPKWRYNIHLAEKRGVRVSSGGLERLGDFYKLYVETGERDGFLVRRFEYYREIWTALLQAGFANLFFASLGNELIAGLMLFTFSGRAWYFYGASSNAHRDKMPNHLLQWEAIRWAHNNGCFEYDFWGAPDNLDVSDPMYGVYRFKEGFGARFVRTVGAHDFVVNPMLYFLYARVYPWYINRMRKRHALGPMPGD